MKWTSFPRRENRRCQRCYITCRYIVTTEPWVSLPLKPVCLPWVAHIGTFSRQSISRSQGPSTELGAGWTFGQGLAVYLGSSSGAYGGQNEWHDSHPGVHSGPKVVRLHSWTSFRHSIMINLFALLSLCRLCLTSLPTYHPFMEALRCLFSFPPLNDHSSWHPNWSPCCHYPSPRPPPHLYCPCLLSISHTAARCCKTSNQIVSLETSSGFYGA